MIKTGTASDLTISSSNTSLLASLGIGNGSATTTHVTPASGSSLQTGTVLDIAAVGNGTATNITFGTGASQIINPERSQHGAGGEQPAGHAQTRPATITITTTNNAARRRSARSPARTQQLRWPHRFGLRSPTRPRRPPAPAWSRSTTTSCQQINTTAQDSSFNGINLLNGDTLKLMFNETGTSTLNITGRHLQRAGPWPLEPDGRHRLHRQRLHQQGADVAADASNTLRTEASNLGSNLSVVQIRQDFNKNLINVLQTGASNLTLADPNEEAANSQALSTRQSIAVSALALANQSQQSVLQLLR